MRLLYRRLLRLYPAEFRGEFAREMERQFAAEYREVDDRGSQRRFLLRAIVDVLVTAPAELARSLRQDMRHALRIYLKTPLGSGIAVLALAIAMAFVGLALSLWNEFALKPHGGFESSGRIATIGLSDGSLIVGLPVALIDDLDQTVSSFQGIVGIRSVEGFIDELDEEPIRVSSELVTAGFFPILNPRLEIGRPFEPHDHGEGAEPVVILSFEFWRQQFGGRRDVVGDFLPVTIRSEISMPPNPDGSRDPNPETVQLRRIVGVMAEGMESGQPFESADIWMPYEEVRPSLYLGDMPSFNRGEDRPAVSLEQLQTWLALGRLADGADVPAAQAELRTRYADERLQQFGVTPDSRRRLSAVAGLVRNIRSQQELSRLALLFVAGTLGLTLVAAANASLFLLSRAPGRVRELGIRVSLGATTRRLVRQLVSEAVLLLFVATVIGVLFNAWFAVFLQGLGLFIKPLDWRVLGMLAGVMMLFGGFVSLAPILGLKRLGIAASTRFVTARAGVAQRLSGNIQLTAAAVLAGLAISFGWQLSLDLTADRGFSSEDVVVVATPRPGGSPLAPRAISSPAARALEAERRREIIGALPGVRAVTFADSVPGIPANVVTPKYRSSFRDHIGDAQEEVMIRPSSVGPGYAELLDMQLIQGRLLEANDPDSALINETFARTVWGRTDVVGESVPMTTRAGREYVATIVGVLKDVSFLGPSQETEPTLFTASAAGGHLYLLETTEAPAAIERLLRQKLDSGELEMEIESVAALEDPWSEGYESSWQRAQFSSIAAILIIALAAFGFYGTQRYLVTVGRREYAIRAALGAGPRSLRRLVLARGMMVSAPGLVFGVLLAYIAISVLQGSLFTEAVAPLGVAALVALAILGLVLFSTVGPARQASATAPAPLLKED